MDGLHRNSGLPELRIFKRRKSGKPDLRCQARQWRGSGDRATLGGWWYCECVRGMGGCQV